MKNNIKLLSLTFISLSSLYLNSYDIIDTVTLNDGKRVEIIQLSSETDASIFQKGKETFIKSFEQAYSKFSAQDLYLEDKPGFVSDFLKAALEDEEIDFQKNKPNTHFLVARVEGADEVIGFVAHDVNSTKNQVYIRQLAVATPVQHQGLGEKLALGVINKIAPETKEVVVCTRSINEQAKRFYMNKLVFTQADMQEVHPELPAYKYQGFKLLLK